LFRETNQEGVGDRRKKAGFKGRGEGPQTKMNEMEKTAPKKMANVKAEDKPHLKIDVRLTNGTRGRRGQKKPSHSQKKNLQRGRCLTIGKRTEKDGGGRKKEGTG